ncbi:hypothetical protein RUMTOR_02565 [[Ruminococcus] torques ATCC 27756]|uniref:Uncharacterized protein n=1 Tax=[Ruminococcus] torques ATCC 27756 TaxID=411460 RepID=A5KQM5_9FIRM|nr:hypothetical protein RUMTOR_02565 [[Ruminococcus] torques ATCC 27756]
MTLKSVVDILNKGTKTKIKEVKTVKNEFDGKDPQRFL